MENQEEERLSTVFSSIEKAMDADNLIDEKEFNGIQQIKKEHNIRGAELYTSRTQQIESLLYLQFHILLLDDELDLSERKEIGYYREIFGLSRFDMLRIEQKVREDKVNWKNRNRN